MIPLLARKYIYRYLVVAFALPILARVLVFAGLSLEKRSGKSNFVSKGLKKAGRFAERRAEKKNSRSAKSA